MGVQRWLCLVLASLRVLISQSKEETVLSRLQELALTVGIFKQTLEKHKSSTPIDDGPEKVESPLGISAEEVLARWVFYCCACAEVEGNCRIFDLKVPQHRVNRLKKRSNR